MFQRLSNLLFGEVEEVAAELKGPNPCVTEADEEGWMLVNLPGESQQRKCSGGLHRLGNSQIVFYFQRFRLVEKHFCSPLHVCNTD